MPASIEFLPRKEFHITFADGRQINGQFSTWTLSRFCEKRNVGIGGVDDILLRKVKNNDGSDKLDGEGNQVYDLRIQDIVDFILCAIEYSCRKRNDKFTLTDVDFCSWLDDYKEDTGQDGILVKIYQHSASVEKKSEPLASP